MLPVLSYDFFDCFGWNSKVDRLKDQITSITLQFQNLYKLCRIVCQDVVVQAIATGKVDHITQIV